MRPLASAFVLLFLASATALEAQTISVGTRVRVQGSDIVVPVLGHVQTIRNDTLLVLEEGQGAQLWRFPIREIRSVDVSDGIGHFGAGKMRTWGLIGAGIGAVLSLPIDFVLNRNAEPGFKYNYFKGIVIGGVAGGALGAAYGASRPVERWRNVPVPTRISVVPSRSGLALGLGFSF